MLAPDATAVASSDTAVLSAVWSSVVPVWAIATASAFRVVRSAVVTPEAAGHGLQVGLQLLGVGLELGEPGAGGRA